MSDKLGRQRTLVATATNLAVEFEVDTDLGLTFDFDKSQNLVPDMKRIATVDTIVAGKTYSLGPGGSPKEIICTSTSAGSGTGAKFRVTTKAAAGNLKAGSSVKNTAAFDNYQNNLTVNENIGASAFVYARINATNIGFTGTTSAVAGTSATGNSGTFLVEFSNGAVIGATVSAPGSAYLVGDVVTLTAANLQTGIGAGHTVQSDLTLLLTEDNVLGGLGTVTVLEGGEGHAINDTLTLTEEGSGITGDGTVDVATLSGSVSTPGNNVMYPSAFLATGATGTAPYDVQYMDSSGNTQVFGGIVAGRYYRVGFKQVLSAGTTVANGELQIYYDGEF